MRSPSPADDLRTVRRARPLLGTRVEIAASDVGDERCLHFVVDEAFASIERVQRLMSYQDPDSDLSLLNRTALLHPHAVDLQTYHVCEAALQFAGESEGAFDPTVAGRLEQSGLLPAGGGALDEGATWRDIELCGDQRIRFHRPLRIDLGGIAKGYAVDLALTLLQGRVANALVNAGGDLRAAGDVSQTVHLRHPQHPLDIGCTLELRNAALATSAAYFSRQSSPTGEVSALIEARTRQPYVGSRSVSVRAPDCMSADALTKVLLFAPPSLATACLAAHGAQGYLMQLA